jgi:hypothetical protein
MKFLIQHNLINVQSLLEISYAIADKPNLYVGVIPFSDEITANEELVGVDYIPYGSTSLTTISYQRGYKGLHFDMTNFSYKTAASNRDDMMNAEHILQVEDAIKFLQSSPDDKLWFVRPDKDLKHFTGTVMESKELWLWLTDAMVCGSSGTYKMEEDMIIVLAEPKVIQAEWRYFIIDHKVIDGSMYRYRGNLFSKRETDPDVLAEAQKFADKWLPSPCVCMDLALVDDELKVIEFNCINSSGFYDNDVSKIFNAWYQYEESHKLKDSL